MSLLSNLQPAPSNDSINWSVTIVPTKCPIADADVSLRSIARFQAYSNKCVKSTTATTRFAFLSQKKRAIWVGCQETEKAAGAKRIKNVTETTCCKRHCYQSGLSSHFFLLISDLLSPPLSSAVLRLRYAFVYGIGQERITHLSGMQ